MGFRRSPDDVETQREWQQFLSRHASLVNTAALPACVTETRARWDDFLLHGYLDHHTDASDFTVQSLSVGQFAALRELAARYFAETKANYTPIALADRAPDRAT